jgi:hypothetical protein
VKSAFLCSFCQTTGEIALAPALLLGVQKGAVSFLRNQMI